MLFLSMHPSLKSGYAICNSQAGKWHESLADELMRAAGSRFFLGWQNHHSPSTLNLCIILERGQYTGRSKQWLLVSVRFLRLQYWEILFGEMWGLSFCWQSRVRMHLKCMNWVEGKGFL
jgi:hypothetical protein